MFEASRVPSADNRGDVPGDSRAYYLYREEQHSLSLREALRLLAKSWRFIRPHRWLVALKFLFALASLPIFLFIPWPLKIIIDNVINRRPLQGVPRWLLFPLAGDDRLLLLAVITGLLFLGILLVGTVGGRQENLDAHVASGGLDRAGMTTNQVNSSAVAPVQERAVNSNPGRIGVAPCSPGQCVVWP
jgi:hypothetical protein